MREKHTAIADLHGKLVEKLYTVGLCGRESSELNAIRADLDRIETIILAPAFKVFEEFANASTEAANAQRTFIDAMVKADETIRINHPVLDSEDLNDVE